MLQAPQNYSHRFSDDSIHIDVKHNKMPARRRAEAPLRKSVKFAAFDEVLEVPNIDDMFDKEMETLWYTAKEIKDIRAECLRIVEMLEDSEKEETTSLKETNTFSFRGLEGQTTTNWMNTCQTRNSLYYLVLTSQEFQRRDIGTIYNDMTLAELCHRHTAKSQEVALVKGLCDAFAIHSC